MPGSDRKREAPRQGERLVPSLDRGASRASNAATGGQKAVGVQRIEQRANASTPRQRSRSASGVSPRPSSRGRQAAGAGSGRRGQPSVTPSKQPGRGRNQSGDARDLQIWQLFFEWWRSLEPHQQQKVIGSLLFVLSLVLFASLTIFSSAPVLSGIRGFFLTFFGWSAYILSIGLIAYAVAHLVEGFQRKHILRGSFVLGMVAIWLLILIESRLIMGPMSAGVLAEFMVSPFSGWNPAIQHVTVFGLLLIAIIITFRITFGHVLIVARLIQNLLLDDARLVGKQVEDEDEMDLRSFRGQRPQFSRYGASRSAMSVDLDDEEDEYVPPQRQVGRSRAGRGGSRAGGLPLARTYRRPLIDDEDSDLVSPDDQTVIEHDMHEDETIAFDDHYDFGADGSEEDDPLNDINLHKQQIGRVPRFSRNPQPLDLTEHSGVVRGVKQQPMLFDSEDFDDEDDSNKIVLQSSAAIEPQPLSLEPKIYQDDPDLDPEPTPPKSTKKSRVRNVVNNAADNADKLNKIAATSPNRGGPNLKSAWKVPGTSLLNNPDTAKLQLFGEDTANLARLIQDTLRSFRVDAEVREDDISIGPTIIRFGIRPTGKPQMMLDERTGRMVPVKDVSGQIVYETRTRVSRIMALQNDLALVLEAKTIRMEAPVPGRPYVGVEIPNKNSRLVTLREVLDSKEYQAVKKKSLLAIGLGKDVAGQVRVGDLAKMPHLLIAGATGAGKSVCINTIIASILTQATPDDVRLLMVDPKMVELNMYNGIPHLLSPVVTETDKVVSLLRNAIAEMERRYRLFSQLGVRNLDGYRKMRLEKINQGDTSLVNLPAIVIIIDELADLMMAAPEEVEGMICRLAQLARATGIHLVVATQRPSVDVITGLIKANIPTRISFMVSSAVDSRTIIDMGGAERLLGRGDMLYLPADAGRPERIQGAFLADEEAQYLTDYWRQQIVDRALAIGENPVHNQEVEPGWELKAEVDDEPELEDDLLDKAEDVVREYGRASISLLQRRLKIGYSRAARLIDLLEHHGIIGQLEPGGRAREVYDNGNSSYQRDDDGSSMSDVADDIIEEERARNEFVRNQAARFQTQRGQSSSHRAYNVDDEIE